MTTLAQPKIPFSRPYCGQPEADSVLEVLKAAEIGGQGSAADECQELISGISQVRWALLTPSCTAALEMMALMLDLEPGDEILVPAFTFASTVNAFMLRGARPVFVDIRPDTLNIDESLVMEQVTTRTRAIVAVHYGGIGCNMSGLTRCSERAGIELLEDNAHGFGGYYRDRPLGSFGRFAGLSFHHTKNIVCGEGGALLGRDVDDLRRAEILREKGTDRTRFFRGETAKYEWQEVGSSYVLSNLLAAFLRAQLSRMDEITAGRVRTWRSYHVALEGWAAENGIVCPSVPAECTHPAHLYYLLFPSRDRRDGYIQHMRQHGIHVVFHYQPLHRSPMGSRLWDEPPCLPVTESVAARLARLPLYYPMSDGDVCRVIEATLEWSS